MLGKHIENLRGDRFPISCLERVTVMPFHKTEEYREELAHLERALLSVMSPDATHFTSIEDAARRIRVLSAMLETVPVGVAVVEAPSGRFIMGNRNLEMLVGHPLIHSENTDAYDAWVSFHPDGRRVQSHEYPASRIIRDGVKRAEMDVHYQCGDGVLRWRRIIGNPVLDENGEMFAATVAMIDIENERQAQAQQNILIGELNHRVKNLFAVVQSVVTQTLRNEGVDFDVQEKVAARIDAHARAHSQLLSLHGAMVSIEEIAREILGSFIQDGRIHIDGPRVDLPEREAMALSMAFFELSTNAQKYGALTSAKGRVNIHWAVEEDGLHLHWIETGGPPPQISEAKGFGSFVLDRALAMQTRGKVDIDYPETGLIWKLTAPLTPRAGSKAGQ